jgi:hypothetical protein
MMEYDYVQREPFGFQYFRQFEGSKQEGKEYVDMGEGLQTEQHALDKPYEALIETDTPAGYISALGLIQKAIAEYEKSPDETAKMYSISSLASALTLLVVYVTVTMPHREGIVSRTVIALLGLSIFSSVLALVCETFGKTFQLRYNRSLLHIQVMTPQLLEQYQSFTQAKTALAAELATKISALDKDLKDAASSSNENEELIADLKLAKKDAQAGLENAKKNQLPKFLAYNIAVGVTDIIGRLNAIDRDKFWFENLFLVMRLSIAVSVLLLASAGSVVSATGNGDTPPAPPNGTTT